MRRRSRSDPHCPLRRMLLAGLGGLGGLGTGLSPAAVHAWGADPVPQCGKGAPPAYPPADKPPLLQCWVDGGRQDGPQPDCGPLRLQDHVLLVRLTASFVAPGGLDDQLARIGAVSSLKGMPYWSFTDRRRQPLIREAYAIDALATARQRPDFALAELKRGQDLYFVHSDNRSSALVPFAMRVVQQGPESFAIRVENMGDVKFMGLTVLAPQEIQWGVSVEHLGGNRYGYRALLGLRKLRMGSADTHRLSNLARVVAMFDLFSGRVTEIESYR